MNQAVALLPTSALRWGNAALVAALLGSIGIVALVVLKAPGLAILLPALLLAGCIGAFLFTQPRLNFIVWLGGLAFLFSSEPGFQLHEVAYGLYFYGYLAHWYGRRAFLYKRSIVQGSIDVAVALWLTVGLTLGITLGLLFGGSPQLIRGEAISLTMLAIYFPVKEFCIRDKRGPEIVLAIIVWIGLWIAINNILVARYTFAQATALWEIADVRTSGRELLLTFPGVLLLAVLPALKNKRHQIAVAVIVCVLLVGLILTKSRSFWIEYIVAVTILITVSPAPARRSLVVWCAMGLAFLVVVGLLFFSAYFNLLLAGITSRFASIGAASVDISLVNRFVETETVWRHVSENPILGYGLGRSYSFYDIIAQRTLTRSYSHIGVVTVLYKFGLWGGLLVGFTWLRSMFTIFTSSRTASSASLARPIQRGIFACSLSMILPALTTSVFFEDEKLAAFVLITALGIGIHYRMSPEYRTSDHPTT